MRLIAVLAVLVFASSSDALTQEPLQPGQRVRVTVPSHGLDNHEETFRSVRADTLVLSSGSYPLSDVGRLDVHAGRHSHPWRGAAIGALSLGIAGAVAAAITCNTLHESCKKGERAIATVGGAAAGAVLGAGVGLLIKTDKWEEVPLDGLRVSIVPIGSGFGIGARIAF